MIRIAAVMAALMSALLLSGAAAAGEPATAAAGPADCIHDTRQVREDGQMVVLENRCDFQVNVRMCVREAGSRQRDYYFFIMARHATARYPLPVRYGEQPTYGYRTCGKPNCMPPKAGC